MLKHKRNLVLDIFDYSGSKQCSLYDQTADTSGQAYDVIVTTERNGWKEISFSLPQQMHTDDGDIKNFRVDYIKEGYKIRLIDDEETDWFILSETKITHNNYTKVLNITAGHVSQLLKHKRLDLEFSDEEGNNVGTAEMLLTTILEGTGWEPGFVDTFKEKDGSEKYRSMKASAKTGAFKLIANMCDLFEAKPIYHGDTKTVDIVPLNPFSEPANGGLPDVQNDDVVELHYGTNVSNVIRTLNEENVITKLYAYGSYGDKSEGYCGIDECTHYVYKLIIGDPVAHGIECQINLTDADGNKIVRYFIAGENCTENYRQITEILYSDLDPASRMYVWDDLNKCAYLLYENKRENETGAFFTEDSREEKQNMFSFLMDFTYYNDIGLLTNGMLQEIAKYQTQAPGYMKIVNDKAAIFADELTDLSETIGSVDFCKLDCRITKPANGYVQLSLNVTDEQPKGVVYRTDYSLKEDKQFKWRVADKLKANGDPVHEVASIVYIIYEATDDKPLMFEKAYLKTIDDEEDPHILTLWLASDKSKYVNQPYRVYLFAQQNVNGLLGAYETADEATETALESSTKLVTVKHPVFFEKDEPSSAATVTNGYAWWWKWYEGDTPSELYFCWNTAGDTGWQRVIMSDEDPDSREGYYWYNWKKSQLYRKESGEWQAKKTTAADRRINALFGTVYASCQTRDRYQKGLYQNYTYTATDALPAGNYAFENGYGGYWVFTTTEDLQANDTLVYDTTLSTVTQTVSGVDEILETRAHRFDNVNYYPDNMLKDAASEKGNINIEDGTDIDDLNNNRTGFIKAYPNVLYRFTGYNSNDLKVFYYNEQRFYLGYTQLRANDATDVSPENTEYMRLVGPLEFDTASVTTDNAEDKIIAKENVTYTILHDVVGSGELKGIVPLTKKFADLADQAYGYYYHDLKAAQEEVKRYENAMATALGDLYKEGYWQKNDYVDGDEQKLHDDALDNLEKLSKPEAKYDVTYLDLYGADNDNKYNSADGERVRIMWPDVSTKKAAHLVDPEININCWAFVDKVQKCYDQPWKTKISINTNLTTISQHSFTDVMSHIADVASETKGKMSLYERAAAITENGAMAAERLQGKVDANKVMITGGSSTWYTDDKGNMVFVSADGAGAMTLTGNGFAIANSKDEWGDWNWRTFGTSEGFTADEITTGYLSAERILAGSITAAHLDAGVGGELDISANKSLKLVVSNLMTEVGNQISSSIASIDISPDSIVNKIESVTRFTDKYATKEDIDDIVIGNRNYIKYSKDMFRQQYHVLKNISLVGSAIVGVTRVE